MVSVTTTNSVREHQSRRRLVLHSSLGSAKTCGAEPFTGAVPNVVADLIHRVTAA